MGRICVLHKIGNKEECTEEGIRINRMTAAAGKKKDPRIAYRKAEGDILKGDIVSNYLLAGKELYADVYLRDRLVDKLKETYLDGNSDSMNTEIYHAASDNHELIINALMSSTLFSDKRLVVVHEVDKLSDDSLKALVTYLKSPFEGICLVLISIKLNMMKKWWKDISSLSLPIKIETPFENQLPEWITSFVNIRGKSITASATNLIRQYAGDSLQMLDMEIEKLSIYVGAKEEIDDNDVKGAMGFSRELSPFDLGRFLAQKNVYWCLQAVRDMLDRGVNAIGIIIPIYNFLFNTLADIERGYQPPSGFVPPYLQIKVDAVRNWNRAELQAALIKVKDVDLSLKSSRKSANLILTEFLTEILIVEEKQVA